MTIFSFQSVVIFVFLVFQQNQDSQIAADDVIAFQEEKMAGDLESK